MEYLIFVFFVVFSDAPTIMTGLETRQQCETFRASVEPEILKSGANAVVTDCVPVLMRLAPRT